MYGPWHNVNMSKIMVSLQKPTRYATIFTKKNLIFSFTVGSQWFKENHYFTWFLTKYLPNDATTSRWWKKIFQTPHLDICHQALKTSKKWYITLIRVINCINMPNTALSYVYTKIPVGLYLVSCYYFINAVITHMVDWKCMINIYLNIIPMTEVSGTNIAYQLTWMKNI